MKMIQSFDPSTAMSGTFDPQIANACGRIYLFNESAIGIQLGFSDGSNASLPAFYFRSYYVAKPGMVTWKQLYTIATGASPLSVVIGEAYESQEAKSVKFTEGPLNRQTSIGNTVPVGTSSTQLINDGNAVQTLVESTVSGDIGSAVLLKTDGTLTLGNVTHTGSISSDNGAFTTDGAGNIASKNITSSGTIATSGANQIHSGGILTVGGGIILNGGDVTMNAHNVNGAGTVQAGTLTSTSQIHCGGGYTQDSGDMDLGAHNISASNNITTNKIILTNGSFSRVSKFSGTGTGNFAHGLGAGPDIILCNPCLLNGSSQTIGFGTRDATNVQVTTGAGFAWEALAIKF